VCSHAVTVLLLLLLLQEGLQKDIVELQRA
jgi:hypothetical protein